MAKVLRGLVSKKKRRFQQEGFDLDLSYITPRIIAMGFPSEGKEKAFRNPYPEVHRFLELKHAGHYLVVNLCSEKDRQYSASKFFRVTAEFQWEDHNPPPFRMFERCCAELRRWLDEDKRNVVALHCKAGKGRTGTMIVAFLLYSGMYDSLQPCLNYYAATRTHNSKGVTLASQKRYCRYFEQSLHEPESVPPVAPRLRLRSFFLTPAPKVEKLDSIRFKLWVNRELVHTHAEPPDISLSTRKPLTDKDIKDGSWDAIVGNSFMDAIKNASLALPEPLPEDGGVRFAGLDIPVVDDVKFLITTGKGDKLFFFWVNTAFVPGCRELTLRKYEVDGPHKDKSCKRFAANFQVRLEFEPMDPVEGDAPRDVPSMVFPLQDPVLLRTALLSPKKGAPVTILNPLTEKESAAAPPSLARQLLDEMLDLVGRSPLHLTQELCAELVHDEEFVALTKRTAHLASVQILERPVNQQLAFWLNVFHLLQLHAHVITGALALRAPNMRRGLAMAHGYRVCNVEVNLWKLEHGILRGKLRAPRAYYALLEGNVRLSPAENELVLPAEPLVCFGTSYLARGSPPMRVYHEEEDVKSQLRANANVFLSEQIVLDRNAVSMPVYLKWFQADFGEKLSEAAPAWLALATSKFDHDARKALVSQFAQHRWTFRAVDDMVWGEKQNNVL